MEGQDNEKPFDDGMYCHFRVPEQILMDGANEFAKEVGSKYLQVFHTVYKKAFDGKV